MHVYARRAAVQTERAAVRRQDVRDCRDVDSISASWAGKSFRAARPAVLPRVGEKQRGLIMNTIAENIDILMVRRERRAIFLGGGGEFHGSQICENGTGVDILIVDTFSLR